LFAAMILKTAVGTLPYSPTPLVFFKYIEVSGVWFLAALISKAATLKSRNPE